MNPALASVRAVTSAPARCAGRAGEIRFIDLETQQARIRDRLDAAIARVLAHGQYIMGPEVAELEARLSAFCGAPHAVACASGTDALALALMALGVRPAEAILIPAFTFAATAEVVPLLGAVPVFVDVHADTFNLDPASLEAGIHAARRAGLRPVGVIAVDLFGQPADYDAIREVAEAHGLWVIADAAQSFGADWRGRKVGTLAKLTTTSFFPAKPLGCYGDGGAVFTDDRELAAVIRSLRVHGQGADKYDNVRIGMNARLDTIQVAILLTKLEIFADEILARQRAAARYDALLGDLVATPASIGDVYRQRATVEYHRHGRFDGLMRRTLTATTALAVLPYTVGIMFASALFGWFFGPDWRDDGVLAQILLVGGFFCLCSHTGRQRNPHFPTDTLHDGLALCSSGVQARRHCDCCFHEPLRTGATLVHCAVAHRSLSRRSGVQLSLG